MFLVRGEIVYRDTGPTPLCIWNVSSYDASDSSFLAYTDTVYQPGNRNTVKCKGEMKTLLGHRFPLWLELSPCCLCQINPLEITGALQHIFVELISLHCSQRDSIINSMEKVTVAQRKLR